MRKFQAKYIEADHEVRRLTEALAEANATIAMRDDELADADADIGEISTSTAADTTAPKYAVVGIADLFDCPQTAAEASHDDGYEAGIVIEARVIGTVQVKAVFVPNEAAA